MTNYPKEWIEALANNISMTWTFEKPMTGFQLHGDKVRHIAPGILSVLDNIGALKEPPKPREFWMARLADGNYHRCLSEDEALFWSGNVIHVKEVIE